MIKRITAYLSAIKPIYIDGSIYVMMAVTGVNATMLNTDNAAKYISPMWIFIILWANMVLDASLLALKMFRSTAFANHRQQEKDETAIIARSFQGPHKP